MSVAQLEIKLLGSPEIHVDGAGLQVDTRKAIALLAFLTVEGGSHQREELAGFLWPEYDRDSARGALRRTLSNLRRALGGRFLTVDRDAIALETEGVFADVLDFKRLAETVEGHDHLDSGPCPSCESHLRQAHSLYRGDFMRGFALRDSAEFEEWHLFQAEAFRRLHASILERLAREFAAVGRSDAAIAYAGLRLALDPLHEPAHRLLMSLYASTGRRPEAVRQYRECVAVLDRELGVTPLAETTELYQAIREGRVPLRIQSEEPVEMPAPAETPPLVGRREELSQLHKRYGNLEGAQFAAIEGETGVGKSRFAAEFLTGVRSSGGVTLTARCYEEERNLAYAPIIGALQGALLQGGDLLDRLPRAHIREVARLLPDLVDVASTDRPGDPGAQGRFMASIAHVLSEACSGPAPGVLFVDDLQWADSASLDLLAWMLRRARGSSLLVLAAYRDEDAIVTQRLRRRFPALAVIRLSRLTPGHVLEMVSAAGHETGLSHEELGARLYEETEGLPLFLVEYLASFATSRAVHGRLEWPEGIRDLLRSRVSGAGEVARQLLAAAAVAGRSFDFDIVREASGRTNEEAVPAVEELIAQGLIFETGDRRHQSPSYDFSHEKIRAFVYEETGLARRRLLHSRTADALIRAKHPSVGEERQWLAIADHCRLAGRDEDAANFYALEGEHSRSVFANAEAMVHFRSALGAGHRDPALIHEAIGDLQTLMGEYGSAVVSYETAAALRGSDDAPRVEHKLGRVHHRRGDWESAISHYRAALGHFAQNGDIASKSRVLSDLGLSTHHAGDTAEASELGRQALSHAETSGDDGSLAQANNVLGILTASRGEFDAALTYLERSLALAEETRDHEAHVAALNNIALTYKSAGQLEPALQLTRESLRLCELQGDRHREAALHNNIADLLQALGRPDDAMAHLKLAVAIFAEVGEPGEMEPAIWKLVEW